MWKETESAFAFGCRCHGTHCRRALILFESANDCAFGYHGHSHDFEIGNDENGNG